MIPPTICNKAGNSPNKLAAITAATTGSQSFDADTNAGEKYFKHQLKILCPKIVEKTDNNRPTITALTP